MQQKPNEEGKPTCLDHPLCSNLGCLVVAQDNNMYCELHSMVIPSPNSLHQSSSFVNLGNFRSNVLGNLTQNNAPSLPGGSQNSAKSMNQLKGPRPR